MFTTVRIVTSDSQGGGGLGTGFIFSVDSDTPDSLALFLVTNKHVIAGAAKADLHFIAAKDGLPDLGVEEIVPVQNPGQAFTGHPDPDVDIAIMPIGGRLQQLWDAGKKVFFKTVPSNSCATDGLLSRFEPIEPVTFVGYPDGLYDAGSLLPIVRRGHSATSLRIDYEHKPVFLVDASVFPGSSGSPVFLIVPASTPDKNGSIVLGGPTKVVFLGVIAAVYHRDVPLLTAAAELPFARELIDLGIVYKASAVQDLANQLLDRA